MSGGVDSGIASNEGTLQILLVDDDTELCQAMEEYFARRQIRVESAWDARRGLALALAGGYDLMILDVMMPGLNGFELLRLVRRQSAIPIIMLTARTSQTDRVAGLDAGADDYLAKPFGPEELLARIRAVLRRIGKSQASTETLEASGIKILPQSREVFQDDSPISLTAIEYEILELLIRARGRIVGREELIACVYRRKASRFDRAIDMHVSNLRRKLGTHGSLIVTVRGTGYLFRLGAEASS